MFVQIFASSAWIGVVCTMGAPKTSKSPPTTSPERSPTPPTMHGSETISSKKRPAAMRSGAWATNTSVPTSRSRCLRRYPATKSVVPGATVERRTTECPGRRSGSRSSRAPRMSRMSISMCENDGVPSVMTMCSADAASATRSLHAIVPFAVTRSSTSGAPGSSNGMRAERTAARRSGSFSMPMVRRPRSAKASASGSPTRPQPMMATSCSIPAPEASEPPRAAGGRGGRHPPLYHQPTHEARPHHRNHWPGRLVPRRAAAREGLRGARDHPSLLVVQHRAHRPAVPRRARTRRQAVPAPRRSDRVQPPGPPALRAAARRGLPPGRPVARPSLVRRARVHRRRHRHGHAAPARGDARRRRQAALLPGVLERDVRRHAPAAERGDAVPSAQPVRRREGHGLLGDRDLPRELRPLRLQRDPLQPRIPAARGDVRHPQDHAGAGPHPGRPAGQALPRQPRRQARLGLRPRLHGCDVAHAPAGRARRLRRRDRRDALGARVPRGGLQPPGHGLGGGRRVRRALPAPGGGRRAAGRPDQGARASRLDADGHVQGARPHHGRRRRQGARGRARRPERPPVTRSPSAEFWSGKPVVVTGGAEFLGTAVVRDLTELGADVRVIRHADHDLRDPEAARGAVGGASVVIHLAANVGGIGFNRRNPGPLVYDNLMMAGNLFEQSRGAGVAKLVSACTVCAYPKVTPVPFHEESLWDGYPEESNAPYGLAKKMMVVLSDAYRRQYGFDSCVPIVANLYGPNDNFHLEDSHVIAAMIRKFVEAHDRGDEPVHLWGTGSPSREFLYVDDAARALLLAAEHLDRSEPMNVGTGVETRIRDLAGTIRELVGHEGEVVWDASRPDGQPTRYLDTSRAREWVGFEATTPLEVGLQQTIESFRAGQTAATAS